MVRGPRVHDPCLTILHHTRALYVPATLLVGPLWCQLFHVLLYSGTEYVPTVAVASSSSSPSPPSKFTPYLAVGPISMSPLLGSKCHHEPRKSHRSPPIASAHQGNATATRSCLWGGGHHRYKGTCLSLPVFFRRQGRRCTTGILSHPCSHGQAFSGLVPPPPPPPRVVSSYG